MAEDPKVVRDAKALAGALTGVREQAEAIGRISTVTVGPGEAPRAAGSDPVLGQVSAQLSELMSGFTEMRREMSGNGIALERRKAGR